MRGVAAHRGTNNTIHDKTEVPLPMFWYRCCCRRDCVEVSPLAALSSLSMLAARAQHTGEREVALTELWAEEHVHARTEDPSLRFGPIFSFN